MLDIEKDLYSAGYKNIACIDEVGRGCLAGDVVACAIIMPLDEPIEGVKDSKKLTAKQREELYKIIFEKAVAVGIGQVSPKIIDEINIKESAKIAMKLAVLNLKTKDGRKVVPDYLLIDAERIPLDIPQSNIIKGDEKVYGISCASIIAKVHRDRLCQEWEDKYKGYSIGKNKGYGTKEHREAIKALGPSPIHRMTFLKNILKAD